MRARTQVLTYLLIWLLNGVDMGKLINFICFVIVIALLYANGCLDPIVKDLMDLKDKVEQKYEQDKQK